MPELRLGKRRAVQLHPGMHVYRMTWHSIHPELEHRLEAAQAQQPVYGKCLAEARGHHGAVAAGDLGQVRKTLSSRQVGRIRGSRRGVTAQPVDVLEGVEVPAPAQAKRDGGLQGHQETKCGAVTAR